MPPQQKIVQLIGPPGSGKTTVAPYLSKYFDLPEIRIQDLIDKQIGLIKPKLKDSEAEGESLESNSAAALSDLSEEDRDASIYLDKCKKENRTPNDVTLVNLIRKELEEGKANPETALCAKGMILSDFPETLSQSQALDKIMINGGQKDWFRILELYCTDEIAAHRLAHRVIDPKTNNPYSTIEPLCQPDPTSSNPVSLDDCIRLPKDHQLIVPKNLFAYHLGTEPILSHFGRKCYRRIETGPDSNGGSNTTNTNSITQIVSNCIKELNSSPLFKVEISVTEKNSDTYPLPEKTNALEAETRVYDLGDRLERKAPVPLARSKNGGEFGKTKWHGA